VRNRTPSHLGPAESRNNCPQMLHLAPAPRTAPRDIETAERLAKPAHMHRPPQPAADGTGPVRININGEFMYEERAASKVSGMHMPNAAARGAECRTHRPKSVTPFWASGGQGTQDSRRPCVLSPPADCWMGLDSWAAARSVDALGPA
jgi:hypothetical protein